MSRKMAQPRRAFQIPPPARFADHPLAFTNHATLNTSTAKDSPDGDFFLTFSVISATVGPPSDPTIGVSHETVSRLIMSKRMGASLRDLLNRHLPADTDEGEPESGEYELVVEGEDEGLDDE